MFDTNSYATKMTQALTHFAEQLKKVRTGRAHADMLDSISVEVYGAKSPLNQVANVTAPEAQMLQITPFDPSNVAKICEAIRNDSSLGFNPTDDGRVIRVPIPALTEERRREIVKQLGVKVEDIRVVLRNVRQDALKEAKAAKEKKELSEDDLKRIEKDIDKLMADNQAKIDEMTKAKEAEIMKV